MQVGAIGPAAKDAALSKQQPVAFGASDITTPVAECQVKPAVGSGNDAVSAVQAI